MNKEWIIFVLIMILVTGCIRLTGPVKGATIPNASASAEAISVDAGRVLEVNGFSQIERQIFGLTAYEGAAHLATPNGRAFLRRWGIESIGMPGEFGWVLPARGPPMDAKMLARWFAEPNGARGLFFGYAGRDRYVYGKILPSLRATDCALWMYLLGDVPGHVSANGLPTNFALWAECAANYVKLCRQADPQLKYVHILNEPNAYWFRDHKGGKDYAELFRLAAQEIHRVCPAVQVGGPVLCWPPTWPPHQVGQIPWYTWEGYCKPLLDEATSEMNFFDWHAYGVPANDLAGELEIVTGYAWSHHNKWLRNAITETNFALTKGQWFDPIQHYRLRVLPMMRQTFTLLRNPDKVFCRQVHDFGTNAGGWYTFCGDATMPVTPMMEFYAICKPLRGTRLVTASPDQDVWVEAATVGNRLTVALANFSPQTKTRLLNLLGLAADQVREIHGEVLDVYGRRTLQWPGGSVSLPPESLTVLTFDLQAPLNLRHKRERHEFFSSAFMVRMVQKKKLKITFPISATVRHAGCAAALHFGIKGAGATEQWQVTIAGEKLTVTKPGAFIEVPLLRMPQGYPVEAEFARVGKSKGDSPTFLSFASLVVDVDQ